jgi:hypothetical protein
MTRVMMPKATGCCERAAWINSLKTSPFIHLPLCNEPR